MKVFYKEDGQTVDIQDVSVQEMGALTYYLSRSMTDPTLAPYLKDEARNLHQKLTTYSDED